MDTIGHVLYLEPGEVAALAEAALQAAEAGPPHPRRSLLRALAAELAFRAAEVNGCLLSPAPPRAARLAARRYVKGRLPGPSTVPWIVAGAWVATATLLTCLGIRWAASGLASSMVWIRAIGHMLLPSQGQS